MAAPLEGIRVVDLTQGDGAPFTAMQLGDAGADVIKVEPLEGDWARTHGPPFDHGDGPLFMGMNRNKRSIALDLERPEAREIVRALVRRADVFIENFTKADEAKRLGLDYEGLSHEHPQLIYCDLSSNGRLGPESEEPDTDLIQQGRAGIARFVGVRGDPPLRWGTNYAGVMGSLYAAAGIMSALLWRDLNGLGQKISTSVLGSMMAAQQNYITAASEPEIQSGFINSHLGAPGQGLATRDGRIETGVAQQAANPTERKALVEAFRLGDRWQRSPQNDGRPIESVEAVVISKLFEEALLDWNTMDAMRVLDALDIRSAPWHNYETMFSDPGIVEQEVLAEVSHPVRGRVRTTGVPWQLSETVASVRLAPPLLGEHTVEILNELDYSQTQIDELKRSAVVR